MTQMSRGDLHEVQEGLRERRLLRESERPREDDGEQRAPADDWSVGRHLP